MINATCFKCKGNKFYYHKKEFKKLKKLNCKLCVKKEINSKKNFNFKIAIIGSGIGGLALWYFLF